MVITPEQIAGESESSDITPHYDEDYFFGIVPISYSQAKSEGYTKYFTGERCKNGHLDFKHTSSMVCCTCHRIRARERYRKKIAKFGYDNRKIYGITNEDFDNLIWSQGNRCYICSKLFKNSKEAHLDHCHKTNMVRKLLCSNCNTGLGLFKDNPELLEKATQYLREHDYS